MGSPCRWNPKPGPQTCSVYLRAWASDPPPSPPPPTATALDREPGHTSSFVTGGPREDRGHTLMPLAGAVAPKKTRLKAWL